MNPSRAFRRWPLLAVCIVCLVAPSRAGFLDELKEASKDEAKGKEHKTEKAEGDSEQSDRSDKSDPSDAENKPETPPPAPEPQTADTPPAPAPAEAPVPAPAEPAAVEAPPADAPPLPPANAVSIVLGTELDPDTRQPVNPATEFDAFGSVILAGVRITDGATWNLTGRMVTVDVPGQTAGTELCAATNGATLEGEKRADVITFCLPDTGLPPGRYRLEVLDRSGGQRIVGSTAFSARVVPPLAADRLDVTLFDRNPTGEVKPVAGTDFSGRVPALFAVVTAKDPVNLRFTARIVVDGVADLAKGRLVLQATDNESSEVRTDVQSYTTPFALPRVGLLPGRYRVEIAEGHAPFRTITTAAFTINDRVDAIAAFNLADPEWGGLLESVSGEDGAGYSWAPRLLKPGNTTAWPLPYSPDTPSFPCEIVLSFFHRETVLVSAVDLAAATGDGMPGEIEVWGSMANAREGFQKIASQKFDGTTTEATVAFAPSFMRFLKVRFLSSQSETVPLALTTLRVREGAAAGYQPLQQRLPEVREWRLQPRNAAQQGLFFLQADALDFQRQSQCMGCHVQSQALMGLNIARANDYIVSDAADHALAKYTASCQSTPGSFGRNPNPEPSGELSNSVFSALGLAYGHSLPAAAQALQPAAQWLAAQQDADGHMGMDDSRTPVSEGEILHTSHAMTVWAEALAAGGDPALKANLARALAWIADAEANTTQDKAIKVMALMRHGSTAHKKTARQLCQQLLLEQEDSGCWRLEPNDPLGPSPFATGQVLYALRQAGFSPKSPAFQRGVTWLLQSQLRDGSWKAADTRTPFAATMWPVIALVGSFSSKADPARLNVTALPRPVPPPPPPPPPKVVAVAAALPKTILFVLDCSFSMTDKVNGKAKIATAKQVLHDVIGRLPDDSKVGLRLYGHRFDSMSAQSSTDTQLLVPIGPLNRAALLAVIDQASPHGQTPLVLSTLKAGDDLKAAGGGILIVVTDGEESCGGKPRKAGPQLAQLGVPLRLDVIGFALKGKRAADEMTAFTAPTGGRYYTADDGPQLAAALSAAVSPAPVVIAAPPPPPPPPPVIEDFGYEVFDAQGKAIAKSSTLGGEVPELPPGLYRVVLRDGAKAVALDRVDLVEGESVDLRYDPVKGELARLK